MKTVYTWNLNCINVVRIFPCTNSSNHYTSSGKIFYSHRAYSFLVMIWVSRAAWYVTAELCWKHVLLAAELATDINWLNNSLSLFLFSFPSLPNVLYLHLYLPISLARPICLLLLFRSALWHSFAPQVNLDRTPGKLPQTILWLAEPCHRCCQIYIAASSHVAT